jgi:5-methylcytosine-specific restriction endonuclease McrA
MHRDHIVPRALGGGEELENIQLLCANCHEDKTVADLATISRLPDSRARKSRAMRGNQNALGYRHSAEAKSLMSLYRRLAAQK